MNILLELLMGLVIISILLSGMYPLISAFQDRKEIIETVQRIENTKRVLNRVYSLIIDHVRKNCGNGFQDVNCSNTLPLPINFQNSGRNLIVEFSVDTQLPDRETLKISLSSLLESINCYLSSEQGNIIRYTCRGMNITTPYPLPSTSLDVPPNLGFKIFMNNGREKDFTVYFYAYETRKILNEELFKEISNLLKEYHLRRRVEEASNICRPNGGLNSQDDIYIPWVMQA
ncbi:MAG TPA: type II secretion system protein, partial [Aquifex aeolicus]|nr:type II secretion system protein [Aquifex aeolicus]